MSWIKRLFSREVEEEKPEDITDIIKKAEQGQILEYEEAMSFLNYLEGQLKLEPQLVRVKGKVVFIGDTHGDYISSREVLSRFSPDEYTLIFLGDYVDRGENQIENVNFLLAKYIKHRKRIILLRGNHESPLYGGPISCVWVLLAVSLHKV